MIVIAIANQKGGVGKTTTAVHLGYGLAARHYKTLIVDTDPQGHVAVALGLPKSPGLYRMIVDDDPVEQCAISARPDLWIIPSDKRTERANRYLTSLDYRESVLKSALPADSTAYEFALIDLAPSINVLHVAALAASDVVVIPTRLDHMALDGVNEVLRSIAEINRQGGNIQDYAILPTFYDRVTRETSVQFYALVNAFGAKVWPPIPTDTRLRESSVYGQTLWEYAPTTPALIGIPNNGGRTGGYAVAIDKLLWMIYAR